VHRLLWPESIAVIGASADLQSISGRPVRILTQHGYSGRIYPVNPKYDAVMDLPAYPSVGAVPEPVDLAIVAVPAPSVVGVLRECAAAGVATAVVFSAGFAEEAGGGAAGEAELLEAIDGSGLRFLGPNSEGFINLAGPVPAGFSPTIDLERGLHGQQATDYRRAVGEASVGQELAQPQEVVHRHAEGRVVPELETQALVV
jgi:acetyltransferase